MEKILLRIESRLDDLTNAFHQLKTENEVLRNDILGVSCSGNSDAMGLMETRTLREIFEKTEFVVKKINDNILSEDTEKQNPGKSNSKAKKGSSEESTEEFEVLDFRSKTEIEETEFLKEIFNKLIKEKKAKDGKSLQGTSVQAISNSIPFSENVKTSITVKLTNFLDSVLTDPQYYFGWDSKNSGPMKVDGSFSEVFSFKGNATCCWFLCSFAISRVLRLFIRGIRYYAGGSLLGIGFFPADASTDQTLHDTLWKMSPVPDVWFNKYLSKIPVEHFVTHGNLIMRGHMTNDPTSIIHVEILEFNPMCETSRSVIRGRQRIVDGKFFESIRSTNKIQTNSKSEKFSCVVETVNCLGVPLSNPNSWSSNSENNNIFPKEILPLHRESFYASDEKNLEAMFSYEIISTDLALVIALKVGYGGNSFAAAFMPIPVVTGKKELEALMDGSQWKTHDYKKYSEANEGTQLIAIRNIRAEVLMTKEEKSVLKIRIFAV